jgi:hypothetical protein
MPQKGDKVPKTTKSAKTDVAKARKIIAPIQMWPEVGHKDLCVLFNLSERRVTQLVQEGVISRASGGKYSVANCVLGYITFLRDENKNRTKTASASALNESKARYVDAQVEQKTREIQGEIMAQVDSRVTEIIGGLVADLFAVPARVTRDVDLRKKIEGEIENVQRAAYERLASTTSGEEDSGSVPEAEAEADD